jgi:cell division protein FtsA
MASSEPYLTQVQKDNGVCLVDMGSEVMDLSVFKNGGVFYSATIQAGAAQVTADIADAFDTSFKEAERLKLTYGNTFNTLLRGNNNMHTRLQCIRILTNWTFNHSTLLSF